MEIKKVAVLGAGVMGHGIAQVCAQVGKVNVIMKSRGEEGVKRGTEAITRFLEGGIQRGRVTREEADAILSRIKFTTKFEDITDVDLLIEATPEDMNLKKELFTNLDNLCRKDTIIATNTSSFSITELASVTKRPEKVAGMHWFNPPQLMRLIEVIIGNETSDDTADSLMEFVQKLGKTPVKVKDSPGFVVNRILMPWYDEGYCLIDENVASIEAVDAAYKAFGFRMGPCEQRDLVGLDVGLAVIEKMYQEFHDSRFRPPTVLKNLVKAGRLGKKAGKGFYEYEKKTIGF